MDLMTAVPETRCGSLKYPLRAPFEIKLLVNQRDFHEPAACPRPEITR